MMLKQQYKDIFQHQQLLYLSDKILSVVKSLIERKHLNEVIVNNIHVGNTAVHLYYH